MIIRSVAEGRAPFVTIADRMMDVGDRPSGFDYMRLLLAAGVIALHGSIVCYGQLAELQVWQSAARPLFRLILPMFFALSGFLVAGSLLRSRTLAMFLASRILRIFPALSVEVVLSAVLLGPAFTSLTLVQYFQSYEFRAYWWNLVGHVHFRLPGVFDANPNPNVVNGQLWTVPYELYCYVLLTLVTLIGGVRHRWIVVAGGVGLTIAYFAFHLAIRGGVEAFVIGPAPGPLLVVCFVAGAAIYLYRDQLPFGLLGCSSGLVAAIFLVAWIPYGDYIAPWPVAYATVGLGLLNPGRSALVKDVDYSYGLFLYGYPIQQALAAMSDWARLWPINFVATLMVASIVAMLSWRFVEKPSARLRHKLSAWEDRWLGCADKASAGSAEKARIGAA